MLGEAQVKESAYRRSATSSADDPQVWTLESPASAAAIAAQSGHPANSFLVVGLQAWSTGPPAAVVGSQWRP